ncbi:methyl-accepting chemotaxis protein [Altericista sp. CCNU0014]|uniref:methyl-accepting chemotaxis protein n=1 Tax=Altericista sp. CCNU0014 TaxID=3082949 RepID=UPI00384EDE1A
MKFTTPKAIKISDEIDLLNLDLNAEALTGAAPLKRVQRFVRSNLIGSIAVTIAGSLTLTGVSTWNTWNIYKSFRSTVDRQFQLEKLSGKVVHLDEVLTMSARMAASTGDLKWEERYNAYVPQLDAAIKDTLANVAEDIRIEASKTDDANKKLVDLETKAFELVRQRQPKAALQLLLGPEYSSQKQIYAAGNQKVLDRIEQSIQQQLQSYQQRLFASMVFAGVTLPILLGSWILVLSGVRDYIRDRQRAQQAIQKSQEALQLLNAELKVEATTREMQEMMVRSESEELQNDIGHLLDIVCSIEEGDLTVQADVSERATGLMGDTLNRLVEELGRIVSQVSTTAGRVYASSDRQKIIASTVAESTGEQAQSVTQVLSLTERVRLSANSAAAQLAETNQALLMLQTAVANGQGAVGSLTQEIEVLQLGSDRIVQQMKTLGEFVGLADQFVQDQGEIATQTQVLALNASLVAARAAEQRDPKQFAAVAREFELIAGQVSQLAQQTNEGLANLEQRSVQIHRVVSDVDTEVQRLGGLVYSFTSGVKQTREVFQTVQTVTGNAVQAGDAVALTSQSIVEAADSTAKAMDAITVLSRQIAQQSQDAQQISDQMSGLSETLIQNVRVFKLPESVAGAAAADILPDSAPELFDPEPAFDPQPALVGAVEV